MESSTLEAFTATPRLSTTENAPLDGIYLDSNFAWLLCALFLAMSWVIYITYYNSRVIGYILTKVVNRFVKKGYVKLGSLSMSVLSGKIMFRDVAFINEDFTIRAQDGWLIFRWWYPYVHKEITEDLSHSDTRLSLLLNGFELHMYNRSKLYSRLEQLFGLEPRILPTRSDPYWQDSGSGDGENPNNVEQTQQDQGYEWRDLIPVIKLDISTGRLVFGNRLVPTTLSITFEEGHITYTTKPASSRLDKFTHIAKCKAENFKIILAPSPKYTGLSDEPPRFMGEGFVVLQSNMVDLYYYQDEPGYVSSEPEMVELANGDIVQKSTTPCWGLDIKCGKGTDFSYGPWADRQREQLYKFFFPQDYQPLTASNRREVGEKRQFHSFDIRLSTLSEATIDILFSKEKETNAVHMTTRPGSYLEITIPWVIEESGFCTKINGQLLHLEATTSLQYRTLVESETLEFDIRIQYPRVWNEYQDWTCNLTGCKATVQLIYAHKSFFQALIEDWSSKSRPDLLKFVPYTWHFNVALKEFELVLVANEHNWIDCSSQNQENSYVAICGELFDMSFDLPFIDFIPPTVSLKFWIQGESVELSFYLPETNTNRDIVLILQKNAKLTNRDGSCMKKSDVDKKWRNLCKPSAGWVDCWSVPIVALSIAYTYHPVIPMGQQTDLDITTPEKEELLLSPIRPNGGRRSTKLPPSSNEFDPTSLTSDIVHLELEFGPSVLCIYGALLSLLMHIKENYLGENQKFVDLESSLSPATTPTRELFSQKSNPGKEQEDDEKDFDCRNYRPLDVTVSLTMHDIQGHLLNNCTEQDPSCQSLYLERLAFELHKTYRETKLQLLLSPLILSATDVAERPDSNAHLKNGHLAIAALQVRGDAMFSDAERSLDCETLEYAWLIEVQMGDITGRLTLPQLYNTVSSLEIFAFQVQQADFSLQPPSPYKLCQHDLIQSHCPESTPSCMCPSPEEMKYRMTRVSLDAIDLCLVEANTALNLEIYPIRLATCNLHGLQTSSGLSTLISHICIRQYSKISSNLVCSSAYSIASHGQNTQTNQSDVWLEVGSFGLGPIYIDAANSQLQKDRCVQQEKFLRIHDGRTKRLWFLWLNESNNNNTTPTTSTAKCGCVGGCAFFGSNKNGFHFFHVQELHEDKGTNNLAKYHIFNDDNLGFGESLLHKGEYVFDVPDYSSHDDIAINKAYSEDSFVFTEGYMGHTSPKTPEILQRNSSDKDQLIDRKERSSVGSIKEDNATASTLSVKTTQPNVTAESLQVRQNTWDSAVGASIKSSLQGRRIMRQFSSPTHMSSVGSPNVVQLLNQSSSQHAVSAGTATCLESTATKDQNTSNGNSEKDEPKEERNSETSSSVNGKERSTSPSPSQNRHSSRTSLNGWPTNNREALGSRHSLANIASRGFSPRSVRRAVSTESTHSSDMYFSADEEALCSMLAYESGNTDENGTEPEKVRHISLKGNSGTAERKIVANNRRSLHDIQELPSQQSSESNQQTSKLERTPSNSTHHDPSDSNSVSSMSFISAMSSQEDIALVDLHNQMDKPIIDSPLLMSCYTAHMSQHLCNQWNEPPPLPHLTHQAGLTQCGPNRDHLFSRFSTRWKPKFVMITEGFTTIHMIDKAKVPGYGMQYSWNNQRSSSATVEEEFSPGSLHKEVDAKNNKNKSEEDLTNGIPLTSSKTALIVKLKGDVHIMISPLMLENLKSFIDVLTPALSGLHPLTIINHLHFLCSHNVQQHNQLKKEKVLQLAQLRAQLLEKFGWKKDINDNEKGLTGSADNIVSGSNYEETRVNHLRALIQIAKVNISVIQAAIVEEVISFSALDNLKDLTCVSLLAVCFDNTVIQIFHSHHARKAIQTFADNSNVTGFHQKIPERSSKKSKGDSLPADMVTVETSEMQQQETVFSVSIMCVHIQLRRLKNSSSILKEAMLTVIPYHRSKVEFTFEKISVPKSNSVQMPDKHDTHVEQEWDQSLDEEKMGFIMFECGLEDISLKFVKRVGFKNNYTQQGKDKTDLQSKNIGRENNGNVQGTVHNEHSPSKNSQKSDVSGVSWDTKVSFPSYVSECGSNNNSSDKDSGVDDIRGDASSFVMELKTVWFNFAAPPRSPNTRKIDFTRLDWHLLSTATPAINAWLKPGDRILVSVRKITREYSQRIFAIMACLMVEALDSPSIHMPVKSKYMVQKLTALAKTLQEDPSCQLLMVLRRYLKQTNLDSIEENIHPEFTPPLKTLQRGIVALSRQWKNILYMPLLVEQNMRFRKNARPFGVSFTLPISELSPNYHEEGDKTQLDECEVTDETTNLLMAEGGSVAVGTSVKTGATLDPPVKSFSSPESGSRSSNSQQDLLEGGGISTSSLTRKNKKKLPSYPPPRTTRASVAFPLLGGPLDSPGRYAGGVGTVVGKTNGFILPHYGFTNPSRIKRNDSHQSLKSTTWSLSSIEPNLPSSILGTPRRNFLDSVEHPGDEDLYNWMARQQDYVNNAGMMSNQKFLDHAEHDSKMNTLTSENSLEAEISKMHSFPPTMTFVPLGIQLADAHIIFQPLLSNLRIQNQSQDSLFYTNFGPKITLSGVIDLLKIDIVESEYQNGGRHKKKATRKQTSTHGKFFIDTSMDTPTFICDKFSIELELRETRNFEKKDDNDTQYAHAAFLLGPKSLKQITTIINFNIVANFIAQQVNMPLLRLLHQFSTMYENVKETRLELKANRPSSFKESIKTGKKKCSSSMESQSESYRPQSPRPVLSSKFATPTPTPTKSNGGVTSLSVGIRRPHTLSQRLRASSKGYTNLQEMLSKEECPSSPLSFALSDSVAIDIPESCPPSDHTLLEDIKDYQPRCWRTMFYLLDLYDTMPETKTVNERSTTAPASAPAATAEVKSPDVSEGYKGNGKYEPLKEHQVDAEAGNCSSGPDQTNNSTLDPKKQYPKDQFKNLKSLIVHDWVPLVVFGVARIRRTRLLAMLSGLKLEGELNGFHSSITHRERVRGTSRKWSESSLTGQLGQTMVVLLEGMSPNQQTVVKITVGKSQALYSSQNKKGKDRNSALLTIGPVNFDIPQHPVALHGMMTRSSRQLSTTLQELRATRQPSRTSRQIDELGPAVTHSPQPPWDMTTHHRAPTDGQELIKPIVIHFSIILDSLTVGAALLPSLCAQYQMGQVTSMGVTGSKAKFTVDLPQHSLSFNTKVPTSESHLPSSASVDLPPVHISADYIQDSTNTNTNTNANKADSFTDGVVLCQGSYLNALAEIGSFEHSLTTDLLNHLVLVQKVFMKEVNEVVQKMSGVDKPVPSLGEEKVPLVPYNRRVLFSLLLRLKGIQITATTPTSSAVRLETGVVELQLSNRVQNMSSGSAHNGGNVKLFGKAQVDLNLALGQLIKNALFEEAEPEFQQFAYFKTRICMRNALQDEMITSQSEDIEAVLITLNRPLIYIQPIALDKAVLVWLNYKNAYEYWNEQRSSLNTEVLTATQQVFEKVPQISQLGTQALGTLFLQLTVDDMGICLPLNPHTGNIGSNKIYDTELKAAVVVTLENTRVSACSCGSLVSKARFTGLCIRFADDFETSLDDWKPDPNDTNIMNLCVVSEGTYEICSRTIARQGSGYSAKWILNVQWQMEGVDIHVDTNIGKQLSALFKTLTALTGEEDEGDGYSTMEDQSNMHGPAAPEPVIIRKGSTFVESLPSFLLDPGLDAKKRSRLIEKEMNEQAKIINDLRLLGASQSTIEQEVRRLHELEAAVFNDFRRDVIKRLRRQSVKATSFRNKLGLGVRTNGAPLQSMSLFFPEGTDEKTGLLDTEPSPVSKEASPTHAHTRTASLDMSDLPNMAITDKTGVHRELSLDSVFTSSLSAELCPSETPTPPSQGTDIGIINVPKSDSLSLPADHIVPKSPSNSSEGGTEQDFLNNDSSSKLVTDVKKTGQATPGGTSSGMSSSKQPLAEPNIDFELDVKVFFNSGKCVLHTKDSFRDLQDDQGSKRSMKKERSFSGGMADLSSPSHSKKKQSSGMRNNASTSRLRYAQLPVTGQIADFTIFLIPGLDVKVHYNSKTITGDSPTMNTATCNKFSSETETEHSENVVHRGTVFPFEQSTSSVLKKTGVKKASLFAWMTLQSIPEETVISPHILDFLEQALEPIPIQLAKQPPPATESSSVIFSNIKNEAGSNAIVTPSQYAYASFPVDVIVYFRMQASILRFSCLPVSRVECLLRLPSVDLVFSSKRAEDDLYSGSTNVHLEAVSNIKSKSPVFRKESNIRPPVDSSTSVYQTAIGGLSMTGCLADFSLYIFHPYGGGKKSGSSGKETGETSPLTTNERKDSLSLQVEFVKVNISRSRKINLSHTEGSNVPQKSSRGDSGGAVIRFSAICDIGSASFKYDMRRLTEILAFPKAWYRRSIARRMFLGDQSTGALYSDQEDSIETSSSSGTLSPSASRSECFPFTTTRAVTSTNLPTTSAHAPDGSAIPNIPTQPNTQVPVLISNQPLNGTKIISGVGHTSCSSDLPASEISHPTISLNSHQNSRDHLWLNLGNVQEYVEGSTYQTANKLGGSTISFAESKDSKSSQHSSTPLHTGRFGSTWETLVLFAVNLSRLNVHMNMGNVMGNTMWQTRDFKSQGRLSIGSTGHKNLFVSIGLEGSTLDSKGGIVGGTIELSHIDTCTHFKEDFGQEPDHTIAIKLSALESRLDYMGTSVLMGRVSSLDITVRDEWRVCPDVNQDPLSSHPTKRPALIYICGDLGWDQLQLIISKSTTPDLLKMYSKLEEFFSQQFHSSKRVFSSLQPRYQRFSLKSRSRRSKQTEEVEGRHHRHWQKVLRLASNLHLNNLPCPLPRMGTILGGTIELHGNNISLACFHGVNFRSKAWAIFSMREPTISFATESQDIINEQGSMGTHIVQNLAFSLGRNVSETAQHTSMATVCRISRNVLFPPQFRSMHEWFHYTFATSELDDVGRFPLLEHERTESVISDRRTSVSVTKVPEFNHNMEVIFALPSLQLHLKTEHFQSAKGPSLSDPKPTVDCSFVTEFDDHIFVAVDADAFFFLHDLITSYIREKEVSYGKSQSPDSDRKCKLADPTESLQKDWRNYQCHTWHLEPTVRLLSWAGKGIEPYGVDYILQKLGFAHARVTIPKWMQRGCMDPLDKILSVVMEKMLIAYREDKDEQSAGKK